MLNIRKEQAMKIAYGLAGLAGGTLAIKAIEKALGTPAVSGLLGLEGTITMQAIAPPVIVGIIGAGYYSANSKKDSGYIGLGAAMAAGAKAIEKVANKTIFSGLDAVGDYEDAEYVPENYTPAVYSGAALDELDGVPIDDIL